MVSVFLIAWLVKMEFNLYAVLPICMGSARVPH